MRTRGKLFVISAPSGCGKTTLVRRLIDDKPDLVRSVSVTTRLPRPGEKDGVDYHFTSKKKFLALAKKGAFLESEENFGHLYGTPRRFIEANLENGSNVVLNIDVKGAIKVRRAYPGDSVLIFVLPPSMAALKRRLKSRKSDSPAAIEKRLKIARKELSFRARYDHKVINDTLADAHRRLKEIVKKETAV